MKKICYTLPAISSLLLIVLLGSCNTSKKTTQTVGSFERSTLTDSRDNKRYQIVNVGDQWWLAENLDYTTPSGSFYYNDNIRNSSFHARLYTWEVAKEACPSGWRLPADEDWMILEKTLGMPEALLTETEERGTTAKELHPRGSVGFNASHSGWRDIHGDYFEMDIAAAFWTATEFSRNEAWGRGLEKGSQSIIRRTFGKTYGFSVRCIKE